MAEKNPRKNPTTDALFDAILSLETREECYNFFEDLCTVKEISDMAQRLEAAKLLLGGSTYDQIVKGHHQPDQPLHPVRLRRLPRRHRKSLCEGSSRFRRVTQAAARTYNGAYLILKKG